MIVADDQVERCIETIMKTEQTGKIGDSKIVGYEGERGIRDSTGEENEDAG